MPRISVRSSPLIVTWAMYSAIPNGGIWEIRRAR